MNWLSVLIIMGSILLVGSIIALTWDCLSEIGANLGIWDSLPFTDGFNQRRYWRRPGWRRRRAWGWRPWNRYSWWYPRYQYNPYGQNYMIYPNYYY